MGNAIVRAVDIGYGNTKYSRRGQADAVSFEIFPSVAPRCAVTQLAGSIGQERDTAAITVDSACYEIGPDALELLRDASGRALVEDYLDTRIYKALVYGALNYIGEPKIDLLVVGLPVQYVAKRTKQLIRLLSGTHTLPIGTCQVEKVFVLAQPLGGFLDYAHSSGSLDELRNQTNLLIDPGFFTTDWMVCRGLRPLEPRCGGTNIGVSAYLTALGTAISEKIGERFDNLAAIDAAVVSDKPTLRVWGRDIDISDCLAAGDAIVEDALNVLVASVAEVQDIDNIVLCGGGAPIYLPHVANRFSRHRVVCSPDAVFSNVRGFQIAGEARLKTLSLASRESAA